MERKLRRFKIWEIYAWVHYTVPDRQDDCSTCAYGTATYIHDADLRTRPLVEDALPVPACSTESAVLRARVFRGDGLFGVLLVLCQTEGSLIVKMRCSDAVALYKQRTYLYPSGSHPLRYLRC